MQPVENGDRKRAGKQSLSWHVWETPPCVFQWHSLGNWLSDTTYAMRVAHGATIKKKTESTSAWLAVCSLLKREKNEYNCVRQNLAVSPSCNLSLCNLSGACDCWCLSSRWNVLVSPMWWTERGRDVSSSLNQVCLSAQHNNTSSGRVL